MASDVAGDMDGGPRIFVHPLGCCESNSVGEGTRVWAFAHVLEGAVIGRDCNLCDHTYVEQGARIGDRVTVKNGVAIWDGVTVEDDVFLGPFCVFTNDMRPRASGTRTDWLVPTLVRHAATIGANSTIVCGVVIGDHSFVAAGAVVTHDVASHALVAGVPARPVGWVCECGLRLPKNLACTCGLRYRPAEDAQDGIVLVN
jgi:UDP-2-acetamido-3-amino-2,3-dideoxy-glucuronate N-acetyltransferase